MIYRLPIESREVLNRKLLDILGFLLPFSRMAPLERDIFAMYLDGFFEFRKTLSEGESFIKIFDYDYILVIAEALSDDKREVTMQSVRNYTTKLRKRGVLFNKTIVKKYIDLIENIGDEITFELDIKG